MTSFPVTSSTLSAEALRLFVIKHYGLSEHTTCTLFRTGINHTYFITSDDIKYVLRVYCYNWRSKIEISEELKLLNLLKEHNVGVSFPITDIKGTFINSINAPEGERYAVLFSFAKGEKVRFLDTDTCFSIGTIMATIHNITAGKTLNRTHYTTDTLVKQPYNEAKAFFSESLESMQYLKQQGDRISKTFENLDTTTLQSGIVHLDMWYDNMNVTDANNITIFDFDFCGNGLLMLDVAYFPSQLFHIETNKEDYELKFKRFIDGYQSIRSLSKEELNLIPDAGAAIWMFYLGVQARRFDWSNIFLTENYLNLVFIARIKSWLDYYNSKDIASTIL